MRVINRLAALIGEKQARENRVINVMTLAEEAGVTRQTVASWLSGEVRRFDEPVIVAFCKYFSTEDKKCNIGDLLYIEWDNPKSSQN